MNSEHNFVSIQESPNSSTEVETCIYLYNIEFRTCTIISCEEMLEYIEEKTEIDNSILVFQSIDNSFLRTVREYFSLHPIIDTECSSSKLNTKNTFLSFDDYMLLTLSGADSSAEASFSIKIVFSGSLLLIFTSGEAVYLHEVLSKKLNFSLPLGRHSSNLSLLVDQFRDEQLETEIGEEQGCSEIEIAFYLTVETIIGHLEALVLNLDEKANICWNYSRELSFSEKVEYVTMMSMTQKQLCFMKYLVTKKEPVIQSVIKSKLISKFLKKYMEAMKYRVSSLEHKLSRASNVLKTAEHLFNTCAEDKLAVYSHNLNEKMKHFSAVATMFLPLNLIAALWGMNVLVPGQDSDSYWPFSIIMVFVTLCVGVMTFYFLRKKWINF